MSLLDPRCWFGNVAHFCSWMLAPRRHRRAAALQLLLLLSLLPTTPLLAQTVCANDPGFSIWKHGQFQESDLTTTCGSGLYRCYVAEELDRTIRLTNPACDPVAGSCDVELVVTLRYPGNRQNVNDLTAGSAPKAAHWWYTGATPPACNPTAEASCSQLAVAQCGAPFVDTQIVEDRVETFLRIQTSCQNLADGVLHPRMGEFSILAYACSTSPGCRLRKEVSGLALTAEAVAAAIGCPKPPPPWSCREPNSCLPCKLGASAGGGGGAAGGAGFGPGAELHYLAGGAGGPGFPGEAAWRATLGRFWSHDYAERIVVDPDASHVWLITRWGSFREFSDPVGGVYTTVTPSDELRTLEHTALGWTLTGHDGTVTEFDTAGRWLSTADRNGNAKTAHPYVAGQLTAVDFPDGRREDFAYHASGKLKTITEVGTDGLATREWVYTWSGDDLTRIDRPDGTAWVMSYGDTDNPGYMTLLELEGIDASRRVEQGWQYDTHGNAFHTWRGADTFTDAAAVDKWELAFDDPLAPAETTVTDPLGQQIVYTLGRDTVSDKPRVESISGGCPGCGLESDTTFVYGDGPEDHPLLPIRQTDAEGNVTTFTYTDFGQVETRTEAVDTALVRTTTFTHDPTYSALVTEIEQPSTAGVPHLRRTVIGREPNGDPTSHTIEGIEAGSAFSLTTATSYNAAGLPLTIDPPDYGTADATSFGYDSSLGHLVLTSRTDPLVGTTTFDHDAFNRRRSVVDPNGLETTTAYDELDRVREVRQKGAQPADDLVTTHAYTVFGDLDRTTLPEGNVIEYGYDDAGRMVRVERRSADGTQRERTVYVLDGAGNRTSEQHERWDGVAWVAESWTDFEYWSRCHLGRVLHADGTVTRYDYDCNGNLDRIWDANHPFVDEASTPPTERYAYDALDRLIEVRQPWAGAGGGEAVTVYGYDVQDHFSTVTDAEGNTTTYVYGDRDLLTQEVSPVSGTTTHAYNDHGELTSTTDARAITTTRTIDEADRVTFVDFPDTHLDITYAYGTNPALFEVGRLVGIERDGSTVAHAYDRFGRVTQDGALTYGYDKNGNRDSIGYPGGVEAVYTFDFADRESTLEVTSAAGTQPVVTASKYLPSGPLASLALGNGTAETRTFTPRYFPESIALDASRDRSYTFTTDDVGNVRSIAEAVECLADVVLENRTITGTEVHQACGRLAAGPAVTVSAGGSLTLRGATSVVLRSGFSVDSGASFSAGTDPDLDGSTWSFGYQDRTYFLTSATGPWGDLAWSYDKIGNRLSETRDGWTDIYDYTLNGTGGRTPLLSEIQLAVGGTRTFAHGPAGHLTTVSSSGNVVNFASDAAGRLTEAERLGNTTAFSYDGRSYLTQAASATDTTGASRPVYSSAGILHMLTQRVTPSDPGETHHVLYFAGRPVAQLSTGSGTETWRYLTTDHLGTPWIATDTAGSELWHGPFEPFGRDRWAGTNLAASAEDVFLRFPGQWDDEAWLEATRGAGVYYNLYRWYHPATGRYSRPDPLGRGGDPHAYLYARANPLGLIDPLGLVSWSCTVLEASAGKTFGGGGFGVVCDSGCVDGIRSVGQYLIAGGGMVIGITLPMELGRWDLEDYTSAPDAENLAGPFGIGSCSVTIGIGFSVAQVFQGKGEGAWSIAPSAGLGIGCFALSGHSFLVKETTGCCSEGDNPVITSP